MEFWRYNTIIKNKSKLVNLPIKNLSKNKDINNFSSQINPIQRIILVINLRIMKIKNKFRVWITYKSSRQQGQPSGSSSLIRWIFPDFFDLLFSLALSLSSQICSHSFSDELMYSISHSSSSPGSKSLLLKLEFEDLEVCDGREFGDLAIAC